MIRLNRAFNSNDIESEHYDSRPLGHESIETTQTYLHAHLALKEAALAKLKPYDRGKPTRFRANDRLLAFLEAL